MEKKCSKYVGCKQFRPWRHDKAPSHGALLLRAGITMPVIPGLTRDPSWQG
jgi:hypothetical protein